MTLNPQKFYLGIITTLLIFSFMLDFFGEILNGIYRIGFTDELGIILVFLTGIWILFSLKKLTIFNKDFIILFPLLSLIYLFFYYETLVSFVYEYYKLFVFIVFLPVLKYFDVKRLEYFMKHLHRLFLFVLSINLVFVVLQYLTKNSILEKIGYSELRVSGWEKIGRYTGLFDVGTLGATALLILMLNEMTNKGNRTYKFILVISLISIISSSSKASYVILLLWILVYFRKQLIKHLVPIFVGTAIFISIILFYTYNAIKVKAVQYHYFIENMHNPHVVNLSTVEMRAMFWAQSIKIVKSNPFGLGFGTYGDTSAKYNKDAYRMSSDYWPDQYVYLSDSSLSHLIAEQGLTVLLYFFLMFFVLLKCTKRVKPYLLMLVIFYIVEIIFTMGLSAGTWPLLFALIYGLIYYSKRFDKIFT